jgi:endo-1,4-beta-xylanase
MQEAARAINVDFGCAIDSQYFKDLKCLKLIQTNCTCLVFENSIKWGQLEYERKRPNWKRTDQILDFAVENKMKIKLHCLFWYQDLPKWIFNLNAEELESAMKERIIYFRDKFEPFKDIILGIDVWNECVSDATGKLRQDSIFIKKLGKDYVSKSFKWARELLWPGAKLIYNDYCMEYGEKKHRGVLELVRELSNDNLVDEVGFQMHQVFSFEALSFSKIVRICHEYISCGVTVNISEMDILMKKGAHVDSKILNLQQDYAHMIVSAFLSTKKCTNILTWGITDKYSWVSKFSKSPDIPLPFDTNYEPKPFMNGIYSAFLKAPRSKFESSSHPPLTKQRKRYSLLEKLYHIFLR